MRLWAIEYQGRLRTPKAFGTANNHILIDAAALGLAVDMICSESRYPLLTLRVLLHTITDIDDNGQIHISARHLAKKMDAHYDTVTKCLKYLREMGVLEIER